jgi:hypothetical protein
MNEKLVLPYAMPRAKKNAFQTPLSSEAEGRKASFWMLLSTRLREKDFSAHQ